MTSDKEEIRLDIKWKDGSTFAAVWNGSTSECRGCGAEIGFAKTKKGKWIPFDPPEDESQPVEPHWSTCPNAEEFRK
jgi:hypothetical protein